jgi:hypothetical protein
LFPLTARELHDWSDDSEQFYIEQESVTADETLRVEAIASYMALLESYDYKATVATFVTEMLVSTEQQQQLAITSQQVNETVLLVDACYLAVGLASHVLESDSVQVKVTLSEWISRFLLNAVSSLIQHSQQQPPVLLRRILWCIGCCAPYLEPDATIQATALAVALLNTTASVQYMDATVQLACVTAIHAILEAWNLDVNSAIVPLLGNLLSGLFGLLDRVQELESRQQVLLTLATVLEVSCVHIYTLCNMCFALRASMQHQSDMLLLQRCCTSVFYML